VDVTPFVWQPSRQPRSGNAPGHVPRKNPAARYILDADAQILKSKSKLLRAHVQLHPGSDLEAHSGTAVRLPYQTNEDQSKIQTAGAPLELPGDARRGVAPMPGSQRVEVQDGGGGDPPRGRGVPREGQHPLLGEAHDGQGPVVQVVDGHKDVLLAQQVDALGPPPQPPEVGPVRVPLHPLHGEGADAAFGWKSTPQRADNVCLEATCAGL
jgi:hypothetical protein